MKNLRAFLAIAISLMFAACAATSPPPVSEEHLARREGYRRATLPPRRIGPASAQNGGKSEFRWSEPSLSSARISIVPLLSPGSITIAKREFARWRGRSRGSAASRFWPSQPRHWSRLNCATKARSEERRVGKECRSRGSPHHEKK